MYNGVGDQLEHVTKRADKLAREKAFLQLVIRMMNKVSVLPGLDQVVENIMKSIVEVIGGRNALLYYFVDDQIFYSDLFGNKKRLPAIDDPFVQEVVRTGKPNERQHDFAEAAMFTPEFSKAYTWAEPLQVGAELIGVLKLESLHISRCDLDPQISTFFSYVALVLKNEILGQSRLRRVIDELAETNSQLTDEVIRRREAEEALRRSHDELEQRIQERTAELVKANQLLLSEIDTRKRAEARLAEQAELLDLAHDAIIVLDVPTRKILFWNEGAERTYGWTAQEAAGCVAADLLNTRFPGSLEDLEGELHKTGGLEVELTHTRRDRVAITVASRLSLQHDERGNPIRTLEINRDVTERKQAEQAQRRLNRQLRAISSCNQALIRATDEQALLDGVCRIICDEAGYPLVWVGYVAAEDNQDVRPVAYAAIDGKHPASPDLAWTGTELAHEPVREAIRGDKTIYVQDLTAGPNSSWRDRALKLGNRSAIGLPLRDEIGHVLGGIAIYSSDTSAFTGEEIELLEELAEDLAFGISVLRARVELKRADQERLEYLHFLESLDEVNRVIQRASDLDQMMNGVLDTALSIFACDRAWLVYPCDPDAPVWQVATERTCADYPSPAAVMGEVPMESEIQSVLRTIAGSSGPVTFGAGSQYSLPGRMAERFGIRSQLCMAIRPKVTKPYVFGLHRCRSERVWTSQEMKLFEAIGRRMDDALSTQLTYRDLQFSEQRLAEAQRIAHVGYWDYDLDTGRILWSDETWRIYGFQPQPRAFTSAELLPLIHPDDRSLDLQMVEDTILNGGSYQSEHRIVRPTGEIRFVKVNGNLKRNRSDRTSKLFGTIQDITDRKCVENALAESERKYRTFFERNPAGNYISTPAGTVLACNPAFQRMFRFTSEAEAKQTDIVSLYRDPEERNEFLRKLKREGQLEGFPKEFLRKDGGLLYGTENANAIFDERGEMTEIHGFIIDETERRNTEEQLRQAQKMEAIGRLAGGIAHDFNNILVVIKLSTEMISDHVALDSPASKPLKQIAAAADRAAALTRQLLAFGRKQILQPRAINLNTVIHNVEEMLHRLLGEDIDIVTALEPDLEAVKADPSQIEQVILNLCINARDAMPDGGTIAIRTETVSMDQVHPAQHIPIKAGRYVCMEVTDIGIGMEKETLDHIFEPFFTTKGPGKGTGLGLATVHGTIQQSGGYIWAQSVPGQGSTFFVYLPALIQELEPDASSLCGHEMPGGVATILVVEDAEDLRAIICGRLKAKGYRVLEAGDGEKAISIASHEECSIDLLLTDVLLPRMKGLAVREAMLLHRPGLRVIFMSGYPDTAVIQDGDSMPRVAFLQKPFSSETLLHKIREVLDAP